jgi:hypothetical protein
MCRTTAGVTYEPSIPSRFDDDRRPAAYPARYVAWYIRA